MVHYYSLNWFSVALKLKLHLEQTFAWGPHFNNLTVNNTNNTKGSYKGPKVAVQS